ncbi:thioesterase family protein [soil metagenome]
MGSGHRHEVRVRYGEVDQQGVVFNAHYLAYCDDAVDSWLRSLDGAFEGLGWDLMLKKATLEWQGSAGTGDVLELRLAVSRWGRTSFDVAFAGRVGVGTVGERAVFTATITYVGVRPGTTEPIPPPAEVRRLLGGR